MQNILLCRKGIIFIQNKNVYSDTQDNFILDGGEEVAEGTDYNQSLNVYLINGTPQKSSTSELDKIIDNIETYIANKSKRGETE